MSNRHKQVQYNETFQVSTAAQGLRLIYRSIDHVGKVNHVLHGSFTVAQPNPNMIHDIKFCILDQLQFMNWLLYLVRTSSSFTIPSEYIYNSGQVPQGSFRIPISSNNTAYFILDNRYSTITSKEVTVSIYEEWDEQILSLDVVTTIPPEDKSLSEAVERIIGESKNDLKIITPYIDMSLITELLEKLRQGVNIQIVTRPINEFKGKDKKSASSYIRKYLDKNHKVNTDIHARMIIRDSVEALVSSADLTQDSLLAQFNAGIIVSDTNVIRKLLDYFNRVWARSSFK